MKNVRFAHVALSCNDPIKIEKFYKKHFGFERARVIPLGDDNQIVFVKNPQGVYLELFKADAENPMPKVDSGDGPHYDAIRHIAFQVDNVDEAIKEMGDDIEITLGPADFGDFIKNWKTVWIKDPEGNIVEVSQGYEDEDNPPVLGVGF